MKIILFDDHHAIIDTLGAYFRNTHGYNVVGTFTKGKEILSFVMNNTVDIIITDLLTEEELGTDLIVMLRTKAPSSLIIVYSAITLDFIKESCIEAGADLCISKTEKIEKLHQAIIELIESKKSEQKVSNWKKTNHITLTSKEKIIIECMVVGMSSPEIADKLGLSPNTINNQKNYMIKKFDCNNSTELVAKLFRHGFLKV